MMNLRLIAIVSALVIGVASIVDAITTADFRRALMNDDTVHQECSGVDWEMIDEILLASTTIYSDEPNQRRLQKFPGKCKALCAGIAVGQCRKPDCVGFRRLDSDDAQQGINVPGDLKFECGTPQFDFISSELSQLVHTETITSMCHDTLTEVLSIMCEDRN